MDNMVTMDDVKAMQRGKEAEVEEKSSELAARKIDEMIGQIEQDVQGEEQMLQQDRMEKGATGNGIDADAQEIMEALHNDPENAEAMFEQLDPVMQQKILELMPNPQGDAAQQEPAPQQRELSL